MVSATFSQSYPSTLTEQAAARVWAKQSHISLLTGLPALLCPLLSTKSQCASLRRTLRKTMK